MTPQEPRWVDLLASIEIVEVAPSEPSPPGHREAGIQRVLATAGLKSFLAAASRARSPVTVVVNDPHRATDTAAVIEALFEVAGRARDGPGFRLLVATGSHDFGAEERRCHEEAILGRWAGRFSERAWHEADDEVAHAAAGGRARLHRWLAEGRFALGIGSLEPHYFAGVTGAHKTLTIGVMSIRDIEANHAGAMSAAAGPFRLRGNPVFDEIAVQLRRLEGQGLRLFAVNLVPSRGRIARCTAGRPLDALRAGLPELRRVASHRVSRRVDLVVARVDPPLHRSFYQADKGIKNVEDAVKDGGVILLDAPCPDGVGIDRFLRLLERSPDHATAVALVRREGYSLGDHKAVRLRRLTDRRGVRIGIVSRDLPEKAVRLLHASRFETRAEAARWAAGALGSGRRGAPLKGLLVEDAGNRVITIRSLPFEIPRERVAGSQSRTEG